MSNVSHGPQVDYTYFRYYRVSRGRRITEQEEGNKTSLHEEPPPPTEATPLVQRAVNARLDKPANQSPGESRRSEDAGPLAELSLGVPRSENIVGADEGRGLGDALEEADGGDALRVVHRGGDHGQARPHDHAGREEDARPHIVQRQVGGDLAHDVTRRERGLDLGQLVAHEAQLLLHARDVGIVDVGAVELLVGHESESVSVAHLGIRHRAGSAVMVIQIWICRWVEMTTTAGFCTHIVREITQAAECQDEEVNLPHQFLLARLISRVEVLAQSGLQCHGYDAIAAFVGSLLLSTWQCA